MKNLQCQHTLMILGLMGSAVMYILRINLSVAIVAMVGNSKETQKRHYEESCVFNTSVNSKISNAIIKGEFDWDEEKQGKVLASFFYGYFLTNFIGGRLGDKFGGKRVFGAGVFITSVLAFFLPAAARHSDTAFSFLRFLQGMSEGVQFPSINSLMSNWVEPAKRSFFMTRIAGGASIGTVFTLFLGGWLAQSSFGWSSVFYLSGAIGILFCVAWFNMIADHPDSHPLITEEERKFLLQAIGERKFNSPGKRVRQTPWRSILTSVPFIATVVTHLGCNFGWYCLLTELPTYLSTVHHFDMKNNGFISSFPYLLMWILTMLYGSLVLRVTSQNILSLRLVRKISTALGFFLPMILLMCISYAGCNSSMAVAIICAAVAVSGFSQCGFLCSFQDLAPNYSGTLTGISNTFGTIPGFLAPVITGIIIKDRPTIEQWNKVFMITSMLYLVSGCIYLTFMSVEVQPWNDSNRKNSTSGVVKTV